MSKNHVAVIVDKFPTCDFCVSSGIEKEARYDGKTTMGPWGNMCESHFHQWGTGLGLGRGQELVLAK